MQSSLRSLGFASFGASRKAGFTLVELLVTIAIVAVLAALLIPAIGMVRERAQTSQCVSNLRQIGVGLLSFAADNDGRFPEAGGEIPRGGVNPDNGKPGWTEQLDSYIEDRRVYRCPASAKVIAANRDYGYFLGSHAAFEEMQQQGGGSPVLVAAKIKNPSKYILGGDIVGDMFSVEDADKDDFVYNPAFDRPSPIHGRSVNLLFADGGVRAFRQFDPEALEISYEGGGYY